MLEALACARGVVATAVGGVPDVVRDGETGLARAAARPATRSARRSRRRWPTATEADRRGAAGRRAVLGRHAPDAAGRELLRLIA